jgi:hypothetical protein
MLTVRTLRWYDRLPYVVNATMPVREHGTVQYSTGSSCESEHGTGKDEMQNEGGNSVSYQC